MKIFKLFSKRLIDQKDKLKDNLKYDFLPEQLKVKIIFIIRDSVGNSHFVTSYKIIFDQICREYGVFQLGLDFGNTPQEQIFNFFLKTKEIEKQIDIIEIIFRFIDSIVRNNYASYSYHNGTILNADDAIFELNERFKEHNIGYEFKAGEIIKIDSTFIHSEITVKTINLLNNAKFKGANEEYLKALENYRKGRNKECLVEALKAFESTLKIICFELNWKFDKNDTSKKLIQICFQNKLVPKFSQNQFTSLQNLLESGIPTIRNKLSGHGQGNSLIKVDDDITRYALNLTGSNILFLISRSGL